MASCYACTKQWPAFTASLVAVGLSALGLYFTWYRNLPEKDERVAMTF
jgi:hypothetical protein